MCRLRMVDPEEVNGTVKEIFQKLVLVPNVLCLMANSEPALDTFAHYHENLKRYKLSTSYRHMIGLAVSEYNTCSYCVALHTSKAVDGGVLTKGECLEARQFKATTPEGNAVLKFTKEILENNGHATDEMISLIKGTGFNDKDLVEITAIITFITFANYIANLGKPEMDFLEPPAVQADE